MGDTRSRTTARLDDTATDVGVAGISEVPQPSPGDRPSLAERMVEVARELQNESDTRTTMQAAVRLAAENVRGCDAAGITLAHKGGRVETPAYTHDMALAGDLPQYELGEGPCLDAIWHDQIVHSADLAEDPRWPAWASRVAREHEARSMLCFQLFTYGEKLGALNLYSRTPGAFDADDRDDGLALAAHIAVAVAASQQVEQLSLALDTRTMIGQAVGILTERYQVDPQVAFKVLTRVSSHHNIKLRDVARQLIDTGELPPSE
jgi:GAF domain-containing protein